VGLLAAFAVDGVTEIRYVASFSELPHVAVWLCTATDAERDALKADTASSRVRPVLLSVGFTKADLESLVTVTQSQETVDREYLGSWFYAMR
jgi:hypothetical protein